PFSVMMYPCCARHPASGRGSEHPVATLAARERRGTGSGLAGLDDIPATMQLVPPAVFVRQRPLLIRGQSIRPEAALRELGQLVSQVNRRLECPTRRHE